jgi:LL-diaminopimelate aminotransferase
VTPAPARRLANLPPYAFAVLGQRIIQMAAEGYDVIRLDIGSPDMPPPDAVVEALSQSARNPHHHGYGGYKGTSAFRDALARYYEQRFGVALDSDREILPLLGSKEGIVNLSLAFLEAGDIALVPDVGYPSSTMGARLAGADVYYLSVTAEHGFLPDLNAIPPDVIRRAKLLWINYPNNPTGAVAEADFYRQAVKFCLAHDLLLASDNPYVDVTFDGCVAGSALQISGARDCTVEFISFSKTYNMAGWRLGAAVGSAEALNTLLQVKSNLDSGHFRPIYDAGIVAVDQTSPQWIAERNHIYQSRRDRIMSALPNIGLSALNPKGALYVWAQTDSGDGGTYAEEALSATGVSVAPGEIYGPGGKACVRLSFAVPDSRLDEALSRLQAWYTSRT